LVPKLESLIYKGIFSDICLLLSAPNFPIMIALAQTAMLLQSITYSLPSPFFRVRFEESAYASYLSGCVKVSPFELFL
jgi:hypothetical protein